MLLLLLPPWHRVEICYDFAGEMVGVVVHFLQAVVEHDSRTLQEQQE